MRAASRRWCAACRATRRPWNSCAISAANATGVWGIRARNREQNYALNLLTDPDIDFVSILGPAGTGKTLLTLAAGLTQTLDENRFAEIIMTRVTIPLTTQPPLTGLRISPTDAPGKTLLRNIRLKDNQGSIINEWFTP